MSETDSPEAVDGSAALADASNVLVLSSDDAATDELCHELVSAGDPGATNVLIATYTRSPDECMRRWVDHVGRRPANLKIVSVGDGTRSLAVPNASTAGPPTASLVDTVASPADLTGLGITLSEQLRAWSGDGNDVALCFDSVSELLHAVDTQTAFRFLHVLTGRFNSVDASAHYHLDPAQFDARTVDTIAALFDAAIEHDGGEWTVRSGSP